MRLSLLAGTLPSVMAEHSRIELARARARDAKRAIGLLTAVVFGVAFVGAKIHAPGHAKGKAKSLGAPASFERAVRRSVAQGGQIAPAVQPPPIASSTS
jgi:heme/copper-type cytochrome/quinol oxidase subunit 3